MERLSPGRHSDIYAMTHGNTLTALSGILPAALMMQTIVLKKPLSMGPRGLHLQSHILKKKKRILLMPE